MSRFHIKFFKYLECIFSMVMQSELIIVERFVREAKANMIEKNQSLLVGKVFVK